MSGLDSFGGQGRGNVARIVPVPQASAMMSFRAPDQMDAFFMDAQDRDQDLELARLEAIAAEEELVRQKAAGTLQGTAGALEVVAKGGGVGAPVVVDFASCESVFNATGPADVQIMATTAAEVERVDRMFSPGSFPTGRPGRLERYVGGPIRHGGCPPKGPVRKAIRRRRGHQE